MNATETVDKAAIQAFPRELTERPHWLVWKFVKKQGSKKPSKMPYYATNGELRGWPNGQPRDEHGRVIREPDGTVKPTPEHPQVEQGHDLDRAHLVEHWRAVEAAEDLGFDGIGFAFLPGDGLIGIDLDVYDDADKKARADAIMRACGSWAEVSPSGTGLHIICSGETETFKHNGIGIEVFCGRQFFTMTGRHIEGTPDTIEPIPADVLAKLRNTVQKAKDADRAAKDGATTHDDGDQQAVAQTGPAPSYTADEGQRISLYCMTALQRAVDTVTRTTEGGRNDTLNSETYGVASLMWTGKISEATIRGAMTTAAAQIGLPPGEAKATISSAIRAGSMAKKAIPEPTYRKGQAAKPRAPAPTVPDHDPDTGEILEPANDNTEGPAWPKPLDIFAEFPAPPIEHDMLPGAIADYALDCSELIGVDPALVAFPALVACAAALHDDVKIQPKRHETGWKESARLWCAVVGAPSVRKTPAMMRGTSRLRKIDADLARENRKLAADHADQMDQFKDAKKEAKKSGTSITAPERPLMQRMIVEDITVEALSEVLKDNARGVLCIQDELSGWFGMMDAYTGGKGGNKDRAAWLQAYNGGFRQVDRVMRGAVHIPNFSVSMIGGIQPDAIRRIAKDMTDDGLMQRFMIVVGRNCVEQDRPEDEEARQRFSRLVDHLHAIKPSGNVVTLTEQAHLVRERLMAYANDLVDYPALPGGLRSHLGKWSGLFARLLLTYHAIDCSAASVHPCSVQVRVETAEQVERLMRGFLLPHALAYYTDILGGSSDLEHSRWVAGHILSKGLQSISNRDLTQAYKQWRGMDDWRRQRVMQVLEDMSWVFPVQEEGRPSRRGTNTWNVNPLVHDVFARKAEDESKRRDKIRSEIAAMQRRD